MVNRALASALAAWLCASCTTPASEAPAAARPASSAEGAGPLLVRRATLEVKSPNQPGVRCSHVSPIGSRLPKRRCVSAEQRQREREEAMRLLGQEQ